MPLQMRSSANVLGSASYSISVSSVRSPYEEIRSHNEYEPTYTSRSPFKNQSTRFVGMRNCALRSKPGDEVLKRLLKCVLQTRDRDRLIRHDVVLPQLLLVGKKPFNRARIAIDHKKSVVC